MDLTLQSTHLLLSLIRNGLSVSVAVRKPFLKTGNGLRDTKGTNPNVKFLDQIFISQVRRGTLLYLIFKMYFSQKRKVDATIE